MVSGGLRWFQAVPNCRKWFQVVSSSLGGVKRPGLVSGSFMQPPVALVGFGRPGVVSGGCCRRPGVVSSDFEWFQVVVAGGLGWFQVVVLSSRWLQEFCCLLYGNSFRFGFVLFLYFFIILDKQASTFLGSIFVNFCCAHNIL